MAEVTMHSAPSNLSASPDWSTQTEEVHCPLCDYNLRGLTEPRCPECGHQFEWIKLLDPAQRVHPYLFEHHPRRNVWSFGRTVLGGMLPGRFWRSLQPIQRIDQRRLVIYWLATLAMLLVTFGIFFARVAVPLARNNQNMRPLVTANWMRLNPQYTQGRIADGSLRAELDVFYPLPPAWRFFSSVSNQSLIHSLLLLGLAIAVWPWTAMGILMIFQVSMRRAKIKPSHVFRCTVYSADAGPVLAAIMMVAGIWTVDSLYPFALPSVNDPWPWWLGLLIVWGMMTWRLIQSYRHYLRFPHAMAVVLSVQIIFLMLWVQAVLLFEGYWGFERIIWAWRIR